MQSYFQPALWGDIARYTSSQKWHVGRVTLAGGPSARGLPWAAAPRWNSPPGAGTLVAHRSVVPGSIPRRAESAGTAASCPSSSCPAAGALSESQRGELRVPGLGGGSRSRPEVLLIWPREELSPWVQCLPGTHFSQLHQAGQG